VLLPLQLVTMTSDSDGSAAILRAIRDRLAEYKGLVLRCVSLARMNGEAEQETDALLCSQLVEQRDALIAAGDKEQEEEEEGEEERAEEEDEATADEHTEQLEDEAMTDDGSADKSADTARVSPVPKKRKSVEVARADDAALKKQRQAAKRPSVDVPASNGDGLAPHAQADDSGPARPEVPSPVNYRVARTSIPSKKYLDGSMRQAREFSGVAGDRGSRLVLLSKATANGSSSGARRAPVVYPHVEFERQLRESVRIDREVGRRSLAMTRKRQLPRLPVPPRRETHWDLLLQEMKWMATDFSQERNWKRVMQFHLAKDVVVAQNAERVRQEKEGRQIAREVALQVSGFWRTVERIAARSRVRFEESGVSDADANKQGDPSSRQDASTSATATVSTDPTATPTIETIDEPSKHKLAANGDVNGGAATDGVDSLVLRFKKIDVASKEREQEEKAALDRARARIRLVVSSGKRARDAMSMTPSEDDERPAEKALRDFHRHLSAGSYRPATVLAAFQLVAIRWMLELYSAGLNMFLNDQLGMGKAATIVAFLRVIELLAAHQEPAPKSPTRGPHLIIVSDRELHKWRYYLRSWHTDKYVQLYDSSVSSPSHRRRLRQEWRRKPRGSESTSSGQFMEDNERRDEEWEDDETSDAPVFCVLCPVRTFAKDAGEFTAFSEWQMLVVENEHDEQFARPDVCLAINKVHQQQRRVLCNAHPFETWRPIDVCAHYGHFLFEDVSGDDDNDHSSWLDAVAVDKASATETLRRLFGQATSTRVVSWPSAGDDEASVSPLWLALTCLSLRRVRSEVEAQLGKVEELSLSCAALTASQTVQYRSTIAGFAASLSSNSEERLEMWLRLLLRLRMVCNCVDLINDLEKLGQADLGLLTSSSTKLDALTPLLTRLVRAEGKKVVIYSQCDAMFPILEVFLSLLDMSYVRVTGSVRDQRRALCHFADRRAVSVALASTRLSAGDEHRAACVFGAEAIIVLDSDWSSMGDAKLRASWAKMAVATETFPVYRMHCENTVEESLLRGGASLSEKLFGEMTPHELLAVPPDLLLGSGTSGPALEKPSWWSSRASASASATSILANLTRDALAAERAENYCGDEAELARPLVVHNVELDAEEHLLLASTDELTPVEWYAVNYVHGLTNKKRTSASRGDGDSTAEGSGKDTDEGVDEDESDWGDAALYEPSFRSFEELATAEMNQWWQSGDADKSLFFSMENDDSARFVSDGSVDESLVEKLMTQLRRKGMETHYNVYVPPHLDADVSSELATVVSEPGSVDSNQMLFRVSYREPAPPMPLPTLSQTQPARHKSDGSHADGSLSSQKLSKKKQRANAAAAAGAKGTTAGVAGGHLTGVKRKLDQQGSGSSSSSALGSKAAAGTASSSHSSSASGAAGSTKEQRVDLDGIPLPELEDDAFWGNTDLDALDLVPWDDASVLSGILGPPGTDFSAEGGVGGGGTGGGNASSAAGSAASTGGSGAGANAADAQGRGTATASGTKGGSSKKSKAAGPSGRVRKGSVSGDSSASSSSWSASDDLVLKKLFELYGSNWSLIAHVFNTSTSVSRYFCRKRTPRQCYDRYGKIISGSLATSSSSTAGGGSASASGAGNTKDGKAGAGGLSVKQQKAAAAAAALWTPAVLDDRIGLPPSELLVAFPLRHSLPGLPPPSIVNAPSLVEMNLKKKLQKQHLQATPGKSVPASHDDLKSIKSSFDAIIQCMKRKTAPPAAPTPASGMAALSSSTVSEAPAADSTKHSTPSSLSPSIAASTSKALKAMTASIASSASAVPHKSHVDMVSLLPTVVLGPDEVIKRSKEAAVVAVQAVAAVASVGGNAAGGDGMMMSGSPAGYSAGGLLSRRSHAASLTAGSPRTTNNAGIAGSGSAASVTPTRLSATTMGMGSSHTLPPTVPVSTKLPTSGAMANAASWGGQGELATGVHPSGGAVARNGGMMGGDGGLMANAPMGMDMGVVVTPTIARAGVANAAGHRSMAPPQPAAQAVPVTTSTLLHVLDRMPEIKNKIQSILNRTDCSEAQKVAMIARLLSNSNAISSATASATAGATAMAPAVSSPSSIQVLQPTATLLGAPMGPATAAALRHPHLQSPNLVGADSDDVLSSLISDPSMMNASMLIEPTEAPLPLPASLASPPVSPGPSGGSDAAAGFPLPQQP
jgi:hypothetical protein